MSEKTSPVSSATYATSLSVLSSESLGRKELLLSKISSSQTPTWQFSMLANFRVEIRNVNLAEIGGCN